MRKFASLTNVGLKRKINEDTVFAEEASESSAPVSAVIMVADGMGGHNAGELASREAERTMKNLFVFGGYRQFAEKMGINSQNIKSVLHDAIFYIDKVLRKQSSASDKSMGTTCTIALIMKPKPEYTDIIIGHVGDSRAYIVSGSGIRLLTKDDSLVWRYYEQGQIEYDQMQTHKDRNVITQALGGEPLERAQVFEERLKKGEILLVCSDGLHGQIKDKMIQQVVMSTGDPDEICKRLVHVANKAGGKDNVSAAIYSDSLGKGGKTKIKLPAWAVGLMVGLAFTILALTGYFAFNSSGEAKVEKTVITDPPDTLKPPPPGPGDRSEWKNVTVSLRDREVKVNEKAFFEIQGLPPDKEYTVITRYVGESKEEEKFNYSKSTAQHQVNFATAGAKKIKVIITNSNTGSQYNKELNLSVVTPILPLPNVKYKIIGKGSGLVSLQIAGGMQDHLEYVDWGDTQQDRKVAHTYKVKNGKKTVHLKFSTNPQKATLKVNLDERAGQWLE